MTFSRLYFNRGILFQNFRQHGWLGILFLIVLLFSLPLPIGTEYREVPYEITSLFQTNGQMHLLLALAFPVAIGLFLFRYMQSGASSDVYHSLPLKRKHLLTAHLFTGFILILIPIWLTTAITGWVWGVLDEPAYIFTGDAIWMWGLSMSIYSMFMFMLTVAVGMCIGQSILQGLTVYALILIPLVFWGAFDLHLQQHLLGFPYDQVGGVRTDISLITRMDSIGSGTILWPELVIYAALTVVFIALSYVIYAIRKVESATEAVTFRVVKPIFRFGFMFTIVMIGGVYFTRIAPRESPEWGIIGYIVGAIVGYIGAEMLIRKTWLIWNAKLLPQMALYGIVAGLILYVPVADWNGYAARVPTKEDVVQVKLGGDERVYHNGIMVKADDSKLYSNNPEFIDAILALHHKIVDSDLDLLGNLNYMQWDDSEFIFVNYELANGKIMKRRYQIPQSEFIQELSVLREIKDYKAIQYRTYKLDEDVLSIGIRSYLSGARKTYISNPQHIREFLDLLKQDILDQTYEEQTSPWESWANAEINQESDLDPNLPRTMWNFEIKSSYDRVLTWLKQQELYNQLNVSADDIVSAQFVKQKFDGEGNGKSVYVDSEYINTSLGEHKQVATQNKDIISDLLTRQRTGFFTKEAVTVYQIKLNTVSGENIYMMLKEEDLTEAMQAILVDL
ncbi:hypothetical protein [Paenibacillus xylanexedens]|uniref:hypothetical protein n=1 Tax=Paenibacillus xylanexedens TaxID=528191 RepID=UPI0011A5D430|nr:hypothetical protein [Paenibacillus xylanexedens]